MAEITSAWSARLHPRDMDWASTEPLKTAFEVRMATRHTLNAHSRWLSSLLHQLDSNEILVCPNGQSRSSITLILYILQHSHMVAWGQWCTGFVIPTPILVPLFLEVLYVQVSGGDQATALACLTEAQVKIIRNIQVFHIYTIKTRLP